MKAEGEHACMHSQVKRFVHLNFSKKLQA